MAVFPAPRGFFGVGVGSVVVDFAAPELDAVALLPVDLLPADLLPVDLAPADLLAADLLARGLLAIDGEAADFTGSLADLSVACLPAGARADASERFAAVAVPLLAFPRRALVPGSALFRAGDLVVADLAVVADLVGADLSAAFLAPDVCATDALAFFVDARLVDGFVAPDPAVSASRLSEPVAVAFELLLFRVPVDVALRTAAETRLASPAPLVAATARRAVGSAPTPSTALAPMMNLLGEVVAVQALAGALRPTPALSAMTFPQRKRQARLAPRTAKAGKDTEASAVRQTCHTI